MSPATRRKAARAQTPRAIARRRALARRRAIARRALQWRALQQAFVELDRARQRADQSSAADEFMRMAEAGEAARRGEIEPQDNQLTQFSGFAGSPIFQAGSGGRGWLSGLLANAGQEAVGMAMGIPSALQLGGQSLIYPVAAGVDAAAPQGSWADNIGRNVREGTEEAWQQAGAGIRDDYAKRWGPLFRGDFAEFGRQAYQNPLATVLDVSGASAVVGRAPNVAAKATARLAPEGSPLQARARRYTSILGPAEVHPLTGRPVPAGNRFRPDKVRRGTARGERKGQPQVEYAETRVPQRPYSGNVLVRGPQKAATRAGRAVGRRTERVAERLQPMDGARTRGPAGIAARAAAPLTGQAKFNRAQRRNVREITLRRNQAAAAEYGKISGEYNRAVAKLRPDTGAAGVPVRGLGTEHLATRLHLEGVLSPRGGMSAPQLRDMAVARMREGIRRRRKAGERVEPEAIQVERIAAIPDELLELAGDTPRVRRVREAVEAGRKLDKQAQDLEVASGVVSQATRVERGSLPSRVLLAGQRDAEKVMGDLRAAGRKQEARQVRTASTKRDPRVQAARAKLDEAEARLAQVSGKADRSAAMERVKAARQSLREAEQNQRWQVAGARQTADRKRAEVGKQKRMYQAARKETVAQARLKARNRRKAAATQADGPRVNQAFRAGEKAGKSKADAARAPKAPERRAAPDAQGHPTGRRVKSAPYGMSRARASAYGRELSARAKHRELNTKQAAARAAREKYVSAREQAARTNARPITAAEDARLRANLTAAERDLAASLREVDRLQGQRPAAAQAAYQAAREELAAVRARLGGSGSEIKAATRSRDKRLQRLRKAEDEALGLTPPTRPQLVGHEGVYIPHMRPAKSKVSLNRGGGRGFTGPPVPKRSKGNLIADGIVDWNPALLSHQARRATDHALGPISRDALDELVGTAAFTDEAGRAISGKRALRLAQTDPDQVALVSTAGLKKALDKLDELPPGQTLDPDALNSAVLVGKSLLDQVKGKGSGDYVAISRAAADEWRGVTKDPRSLWRHWDTMNDYWKGAILALSPRWYVNSTFGAGMQYGLLTGMDLRALRRANREGPIRDAVPSRDAINTLAQDVGFKGRLDVNRLQRAMTKGFEINNVIETSWRRAAYLNRAKHYLKNEGLRTRGLSDMEIAKAISDLPPSVARQVTRDIDKYMGEFRKFSQVEQAVLRRVIPFYSWLRVITKLTLSLPFRSPARAEALMVAAKMGTAGINPGDPERPWYDRGAWTVPGTNIRMRTSGWNSFATLVPFANAIGEMAGGGGIQQFRPLVKELGGWSSPAISGIANMYAGYNTYGSDVFAKGGKFTTDWRRNPVTGEFFVSEDGMPVLESILQAAIPGQAGPLRRALAAGDRPYDTTSTLDLLKVRLGLKEPGDLFYEPRRGGRVNKKVGPGGTVSGVGGFLGFPTMREDPKERERRHRDRTRDAERSARRREREERRG